MKQLRNFLRQWNELLSLPVAIILWYFIPYILRWVDPTAGSYDIGILQVLFLATIGLYFGLAIIWLALKLGAPDIYKKLDECLVNNNDELTKWQKIKFSLYYFLGLLFAWVLLVIAFI